MSFELSSKNYGVWYGTNVLGRAMRFAQRDSAVSAPMHARRTWWLHANCVKVSRKIGDKTILLRPAPILEQAADYITIHFWLPHFCHTSWNCCGSLTPQAERIHKPSAPRTLQSTYDPQKRADHVFYRVWHITYLSLWSRALCIPQLIAVVRRRRRMCAWTRSVARELIPIHRPLSRRGVDPIKLSAGWPAH